MQLRAIININRLIQLLYLTWICRTIVQKIKFWVCLDIIPMMGGGDWVHFSHNVVYIRINSFLYFVKLEFYLKAHN